MGVPIGEVINAVGVEGLKRNKALEIINSNEDFSGCVKETFKGIVIEGDVDSIIEYIRNNYDPNEANSDVTEANWDKEKHSLQLEIQSIKDRDVQNCQNNT